MEKYRSLGLWCQHARSENWKKLRYEQQKSFTWFFTWKNDEKWTKTCQSRQSTWCTCQVLTGQYDECALLSPVSFDVSSKRRRLKSSGGLTSGASGCSSTSCAALRCRFIIFDVSSNISNLRFTKLTKVHKFRQALWSLAF